VARGRDWHKAEDAVQRRHVVWLSIRRRPIVGGVLTFARHDQSDNQKVGFTEVFSLKRSWDCQT
jgi:hypothetical protein